MLAAPASHLHEIRLGVILLPCLLFLSVCLYFLYLSARSPRADLRILSATIVAFFVAGLHDMAVFFGVLDSNIYYTPLTSQFQMIGMALMLAWHFVTNVRRIERFNIELAENVEAAKCELSAALHQQHKLELANARLGERLNLARDLHDGLGGTLVSSIATLEHAPAGIPPRRFLSILKELRDDLRLIIDTASSQQDSEYALGELLAPLRHRLARLLEDHGIEGDWRLAGLDRCHLSAAQSLDVLRILQEGLTNVVKHSGASRVAIALLDDGQWLELSIADNGHGFCPDTVGTHPGTGLPSMRARAARLGGSLQIRSGPGATTLSVRVPRGTGPR
jgi:signal transduction histidine kinase